MKIVLATSNPHKLEEIRAIAGDADVEFVLVDSGFDPVEDGKTFEENSYIKAKAAAEMMGLPALADDTGLCVDALGGAPGLYSARYAPTQETKISKLLDALSGVDEEKRTAHFICSMVLASPDGKKIHSTEGKIYGRIANKPDGVHGFGYDPVFYIPELQKTMAEMTAEEKNTLSHRALALKAMLNFLKSD